LGEEINRYVLTLSATEAAYIAGIIDGEGSISMSYTGPRYGYRYGNYRLVLQVGNTKEPLIEYLHRITGVGNRWNREGQKQEHAKVWYWQVTNQKAAEVIGSCLPYLVIKVEQALLALSYADFVVPTAVGITEEVAAERHDIYSALKKANKKGPVHV
jgi:hypothetical protein